MTPTPSCVLVVDDDPDTRTNLCDILELDDYQVETAGSGEAVDLFLQLALKPAEGLTDWDRAFLLKHSFYSDPYRMIHRYPRYGELYDAWQAQKG